MKRRDLLRTVSAACAGLGGSAVDGTGTATSERASAFGRARAANDCDLPEKTRVPDDCDPPEVSGDAVSLRRIGCEMDGERPATRLLGNLPPKYRDDGANVPQRVGPYVPVDPHEWNDPDHVTESKKRDVLNDRRKKRVKRHARDLGLAHRRDKGIFELHRFQSGGEAASMQEVARRHRDGNEFKILFLNAALFSIRGTPTEEYRQPTQHKDLKQRQREIGGMLALRDYDIAGLCEVWYPDQAAEILATASSRRFQYSYNYENNDRSLGGNNGLLTVVPGFTSGSPAEMGATNFGAYSVSTVPTQKGWSHTEIDLGHGKIDFVLTHLNHEWANGDFAKDRQKQISELIENCLNDDDVTDERNVTVLGGDFNVLGNRAEYDEMIEVLDEKADLEDAWLTRGGAVSKSTWFASHKYWEGDGFSERTGPGGLQEPMDEGDCEPDWPWDCENYHEDCSCYPYQKTRKAYQAEDPYSSVRVDKNTRLDYVFVEKPKEKHDLNVDVKRVRRRLFPRITPEARNRGNLDADERAAVDCALETIDCPSTSTYCDTEQYLSDHMGLEMKIVASPA